MPTHRYCPSCADERLFDTPTCLDGHDGDCAEAFCVDCGTALLLDPPTAPARPRPAMRSAA